MFADAGLVTIVAMVSPAAEDRAAARELHEEAGPGRSSRRGWTRRWRTARRATRTASYARARAGELPGFTGIDAPYEEPRSPDVRLHGAGEPVERSVERLLEALERGS